MDLSSPIRSVIPSVHGAVLAVLAAADEPLSGRALAARIESQAGYRRVNQVLQALVDAGVAKREHRPPAFLYELNHEHVAAAAIRQLADLRGQVFARIREQAASWSISATAVWFSEAERSEGAVDADVVLLVFRRGDVNEHEPIWSAQLSDLSVAVTAWSGNACHVLEYSHDELSALAFADAEVVEQLRADAVTVYGTSVQDATTSQS